MKEGEVRMAERQTFGCCCGGVNAQLCILGKARQSNQRWHRYSLAYSQIRKKYTLVHHRKLCKIHSRTLLGCDRSLASPMSPHSLEDLWLPLRVYTTGLLGLVGSRPCYLQHGFLRLIQAILARPSLRIEQCAAK